MDIHSVGPSIIFLLPLAKAKARYGLGPLIRSQMLGAVKTR